MKSLLFTLATFLFVNSIQAQCCSGGSGSPIAGGASQGVLQDRQIEIGVSEQVISTNKFREQDHPTDKFSDGFKSNYLYTRIAYGVTKDFTLSLESGYYFNKTQYGLDKSDTITSKGIADLIIFPKYVVYRNNGESTRTEVTLGAGLKIPVGQYRDSTKFIEPFSKQAYYLINPPVVQPTTGSNDFIFYGFVYRGYPKKNFRVFTTLYYIKKGWNALGEHFGNYASVGLFASKTFFKSLGVTIQVKGEWIDKMDRNKDLQLYSPANYLVAATGSKKVFFVPQLSYTVKDNFTVFALSEFPIYQYVNDKQIVSQYQFTWGISYRFYVNKL